MKNADILRAAIRYCRLNPEQYDQDAYNYGGKTCVVGRAAMLSGNHFESENTYFLHHGPNVFDWALGFFDLTEQELMYIVSGQRTLNEIEAKVNALDPAHGVDLTKYEYVVTWTGGSEKFDALKLSEAKAFAQGASMFDAVKLYRQPVKPQREEIDFND